MFHMRKMDGSFIGALQKADPTFRVMQDQKQTAINDSGFEVDVIRRTAKGGAPHPFRMRGDEDDLWAVQVEGADKNLSSERFSQVVVAETGRMAVMSNESGHIHRIEKDDFNVSNARPKEAPQRCIAG